MDHYTKHVDGTSSKNAEQIENTTGTNYHASGNLFIAKQTSRTIPNCYTGARGDIVGFSPGSGLRMRRYLRECRADYHHMVTLTYPCEYPSTGIETKNHLRRFLQEIQRWDIRNADPDSTRSPHSAFWFLEFQARGAPHYHIFLNRCPSKEWVSSHWYEIVNSEDIRHFHAGTRTEQLRTGRAGTISYASKYAAKAVQKVVPTGFENVGRFWGVYGYRITLSAATWVSRTEMGRTEVSWSVKKLLEAVKQAVDRGYGEVVKREEGILIVVVNNEHHMQKIRRLTSAVTCKTMHYYDLFCDAEVDYGEIYNDYSVLYQTKSEKPACIYG